MIPGMFTGWIQEIIGYRHFFVWVMIATIPGFIVTALIRPDPGSNLQLLSGQRVVVRFELLSASLARQWWDALMRLAQQHWRDDGGVEGGDVAVEDL